MEEYVALSEANGRVDIVFGPATFGEVQEFVEENLCDYRNNGYELEYMEA